jgi:hypothetical protein
MADKLKTLKDFDGKEVITFPDSEVEEVFDYGYPKNWVKREDLRQEAIKLIKTFESHIDFETGNILFSMREMPIQVRDLDEWVFVVKPLLMWQNNLTKEDLESKGKKT